MFKYQKFYVGKGDTSVAVSTGPQGPAGASGIRGPSGAIGERGPSGARGPSGITGLQGPSGLTGPSGLQGLQGSTGPTGLSGTTGSQGPSGSIGPTGATGPSGLQGSQGSVGLTGPTGLSGVMGPTGLQGPQGLPGSGGVSDFLQLSDINYTALFRGQSLFNNSNNDFSIKGAGRQIINVKDYGASGDGVYDDRTAIQAAAQDLNTGAGSTLYFPGPGVYIIRVDQDPSTFTFDGMNSSYPLIKITQSRSRVLIDPDAEIRVIANFPLSGSNLDSFNKAPLFGIYTDDCVIENGKCSMVATGVGVINTGDAYNGYPIYYSTSTNVSWNNISFSGFAGTSLNSGIILASHMATGEFVENSNFLNCRFYDWGGAWNDGLITHQGGTLFDRCAFIHRENTGTAGVSIKEHGPTLMVRTRSSNMRYFNCTFKNIGGGIGNRGVELDILSTSGTTNNFVCRSIVVEGCTFVNSRNTIPIKGLIASPVISNNRFVYDFTNVSVSGFLNGTYPGWHFSGVMRFICTDNENVNLRFDQCYGIIVGGNTNCGITLVQTSGSIVNQNFFESNSYCSSRGYPGRTKSIELNDSWDVQISNNIINYDSNIGFFISFTPTTSYPLQLRCSNFISFNHFNGIGDAPSSYAMALSGFDRSSITANVFRQTGTFPNYSIYSSTLSSVAYQNNSTILIMSNIFETPNSTGGLPTILVDREASRYTISHNIDKNIKTGYRIDSGLGNKILWNIHSTSGNLGTGAIALNQYNITGVI